MEKHSSIFAYIASMGTAIFGGLTPMVVALLMKWDPLGPAYYVAALCGLAMLIGLYLLRQRR